MNGTIELHGAKQMLVSEESTVPIESDAFIPGDKVLLDKTPTLLSRTPQAVIGIVEKIEGSVATLYVCNFGPTCRFRPKVEGHYSIGERLVLWLGADGSIDVKGRYSMDAKFDTEILTHMYSLTEREPVDELVTENLYTKQEIVDHGDLDTFTIDPTHSVDFDDAISVDLENNTVYVHIVDIAGQPISALGEKRLRERCLTLYLSNEHTEHLLEEEEASTTLSLVVGKPRKVITVKVVLDQEGLVKSYDIYRSVIVVKRRWNYDEVLKVLGSRAAPPAFRFLVDLTTKRSSNVTYNLNLPSIRVLCSKDGLAESIVTEDTNDPSHSLIATAMILANLTVSVHIRNKGKELPNRFHDSLRGFKAPDFVKTGNDHVDSFILVKRYARAYYSVDERGHFGLGITDYVHFTSPMRRYADVLVHRILAGRIPVDLEAEVKWVNHRSLVVRSAQDIYINWKVLRWLETRKRHTIWLTGVNRSGIMWYMPSMSLNGFIHVSALEPRQFWKYDEAGGSLEGQTNKAKMVVGLRLTADVASIDMIKGVVLLKLL